MQPTLEECEFSFPKKKIRPRSERKRPFFGKKRVRAEDGKMRGGRLRKGREGEGKRRSEKGKFCVFEKRREC